MSNLDETNPLYQALSGMMSQFLRTAVASGDFASILNAPTPPSGNTQPPVPLPTLPVPLPTAYTSTRLALPAATHGHPLPSNLSPSVIATQPILGVSGLGIPLAGHSNQPRTSGAGLRELTTSQISRANSDRLDAAHAHLGPPGPTRQVRGTRRGVRTRGLAVRPPALVVKPLTTLERVSSLNAVGIRVVRVTHLVQAYQSSQIVVDYHNFKSAHQQFLVDAGLSFNYDLPEDTAVSHVLQMTATNMRNGPRRYVFGSVPSGPSTRQQHEILALQGLIFQNMAKNTRHGAAHLRRVPTEPTLTLAELFDAEHKNHYALPRHCVLDGRFLLHSIIRYDGATFVETLPGALPRMHSCLTLRQNREFNESIEMDFDERDMLSDSSGGVPVDSDSEDEDMPQAPLLAAATRPVPLPSRRNFNVPVPSFSGSTSSTTAGYSANLPAFSADFSVSFNSGSTSSTTAPADLPASSSDSSVSFTSNSASSTTAVSSMPAVLTSILPWTATTFVPESGLYSNIFSRRDIPAAIYHAAGDGGILDLRAESVDDLAVAYVDQVRQSAISGDFSRVLRANRRFTIVDPDGSTRSFGHGIEHECIFTALNIYLSRSGQWGIVTDEGRLSLATSMPLRLAASVSAGRRLELRVFGALIALALISGKPPGAMSPGLLQYVLNGKRLEALTPSFISSWHPTLFRTARDIQAAGHRGDLSPFQGEIEGNLGIQISALALRDEGQHNALVSQLVHTGVLGSELHGHLETDDFAGGVDLPCSNGFSFSKLARSYPGGTEFYLAQAWTSFIADADALDPFLLVTAPAQSKLGTHFGTAANHLEPETLFTGFLRRIGNPCDPAVFENAKLHFHPDAIAQLPNIDSPSFRPRMFCWAATGSPFLQPDDEQTDTIGVHFVLPRDSNYTDSSDPDVSASHMRQGTISFRSCLRVARIPMVKLVELFKTEAPADFENAVDSWLLLQTLNGIGKVSML
ncbi:hypothetical protein C8R46DRAFT_1045410 [Mycena filopes]|nr:hypothetical protein C8R46DRAFT_1045410 [Mycena filopes]